MLEDVHGDCSSFNDHMIWSVLQAIPPRFRTRCAMSCCIKNANGELDELNATLQENEKKNRHRRHGK